MIATCPLNTPHIPSRYNNEQTTKQTKAINNSYIYISHVNVTQTMPDIHPWRPCIKTRCLFTSFCHSTNSFNDTVYPKKYAHGFCFAVLCCGYTLTDFPISIRLTSLALWQSNDCPSASKATLINMDKYFMWIHYERLHNHNKAQHNKTVCIFLGIYCTSALVKLMAWSDWPLNTGKRMGA